nr:RdgB/HAM1 family non-canonical purine NTP pyrophosphatase [Bacteroidota bacterium]
MKTKLVFATNNMHKLREVQAMMPADIELITLREAGIEEDIIESGSTFNENALIKAQFVYNKTGINCFADDSGLMIEALNNAPGVYSARYAGEPKDDVKNLQLVLKNMSGIENRGAKFNTTIALILDGKKYFFEGIVEGNIGLLAQGDSGFGYDPIFVPVDYDITYAQMSDSQKNSMSHRAKAVSKLIDFLHQHFSHN